MIISVPPLKLLILANFKFWNKGQVSYFYQKSIHMHKITDIVLVSLAIISAALLSSCHPVKKDVNQQAGTELGTNDSTSLVILWTSADKEVGRQVVLTYVLNARLNGWLEHITLMVWGPSVKELAVDKELQASFKSLRHTGVRLIVDKASAENYSVLKEIEALGVEVTYLGKPVSDCIRQRMRMLTF